MTTPRTFTAVVDVLTRDLPANADLAGITLELDGSTVRITVRTATPAVVVGRRNATVDLIRAELESLDAFDRALLELDVVE